MNTKQACTLASRPFNVVVLLYSCTMILILVYQWIVQRQYGFLVDIIFVFKQVYMLHKCPSRHIIVTYFGIVQDNFDKWNNCQYGHFIFHAQQGVNTCVLYMYMPYHEHYLCICLIKAMVDIYQHSSPRCSYTSYHSLYHINIAHDCWYMWPATIYLGEKSIIL